MLIIFWDFLIVEQIFVLPQMKRSVIVSSKLVYSSYPTICRRTLDWRSSEIRKHWENLKTSWNYCPVLSRPLDMKILSVLVKIELFRSAVFHLNFRVCLKYFVNDCVGTKFQFKRTYLIFWIKFSWKRYFLSKTEKVNTTMEFCIFELV